MQIRAEEYLRLPEEEEDEEEKEEGLTRTIRYRIPRLEVLYETQIKNSPAKHNISIREQARCQRL